jgi:hypothetical protein
VVEKANTKEETFKKLKGVRYVVINDDWGGFSLGDEAEARYKEMTGVIDENFSYYDIPRDDPYLVQIVREMGQDANGSYSSLKIVEIPADVDWEIGEYDGREWVAEKHRTWS